MTSLLERDAQPISPIAGRVHHLAGSAYDVGRAMGSSLGPRLAQNIDRYVAARTALAPALDRRAWRAGALPWLQDLPSRFREELKGLAEGAGLPLRRVAEWVYLEVILDAGCSGAIVALNGRLWVARNNDIFAPDMWGYATIREVAGRIPTITFGLEGDVFTPTGINRDCLWLHYNYLPAWDRPSGGRTHMPCYAWIVEALETCRTLAEVEALLDGVERDGGMLLFAVDGRHGDGAIYECGCAGFVKRRLVEGLLVGTNHAVRHPAAPAAADGGSGSTVARYRRLLERFADLTVREPAGSPVADLIAILADDRIEARTGATVTAYANVACPASGELWYTFGGHPAASRGNWQCLPWPWPEPDAGPPPTFP